MSETIDDIVVTGTWKSLNAESLVPVGDAFIISNKSTNWVILAEGPQPAPEETNGVFMTGISDEHHKKSVISGSLEIWARTVNTTLEAKINVQAI